MAEEARTLTFLVPNVEEEQNRARMTRMTLCARTRLQMARNPQLLDLLHPSASWNNRNSSSRGLRAGPGYSSPPLESSRSDRTARMTRIVQNRQSYDFRTLFSLSGGFLLVLRAFWTRITHLFWNILLRTSYPAGLKWRFLLFYQLYATHPVLRQESGPFSTRFNPGLLAASRPPESSLSDSPLPGIDQNRHFLTHN